MAVNESVYAGVSLCFFLFVCVRAWMHDYCRTRSILTKFTCSIKLNKTTKTNHLRKHDAMHAPHLVHTYLFFCCCCNFTPASSVSKDLQFYIYINSRKLYLFGQQSTPRANFCTSELLHFNSWK